MNNTRVLMQDNNSAKMGEIGLKPMRSGMFGCLASGLLNTFGNFWWASTNAGSQ